MDNTLPITAVAIGGMRDSFSKMNLASEEFTDAALRGDAEEMIEPMTTLAVEPRVYKANAAVIKTYDETVGTLINTAA